MHRTLRLAILLLPATAWLLLCAAPAGGPPVGVAGGAGATAAARRHKGPASTGEHSLHG